MNLSNICLKTVSAISLILILVSSSSAQKWTEIKLLKSNKADVEKILGKPISFKDYQADYQTKDSQIGITYSDGICNYDFPTDFKIPAWTVKLLSVTPKKSPIFRNIVRDKKSLSIIVEQAQTFTYSDSKKNIVYYTKLINGIEYLETMVFEPDRKSSLVCLKYEDNCFNRVSLDIFPTQETYKKGEPAIIVVPTEKPRKYQYEFSWSLSEGEIIEGQNTEAIKIDTSKVKNHSFTVKLTIKAKLPDNTTCLKIKELTIK